ncbi:hypothetical protein DPMN_155443 [Dreissena polymorpha]|uniref:Uncharacterized protein n=1 Tax=Dreissena polymorpha TaxID=45954 RepID=A0A9D4FPG1_DREPO|nr:hypothetical protein DPMN_155443 [Dreissena polymorpha]
MRGPSGQTSLPSFVALGHLLREIIATSGSYYGGNGANTGQFSVPSADTFTGSGGTEDATLPLLACVAIGPNKSAKFRRSGSPYSESNRDFRLYYGVTGPIRATLAYLRRHFPPEAVALRRHIALLACVAHRAKQFCQVSSLWVTYSER